MKQLRYVCGQLWQGKSVLRGHLNYLLLDRTLRGKVVDVGGGVGADYISQMPKHDDVSFVTLDMVHGDVINFELDRLPYDDDSVDTVLFLNVLEHIYNHQHLANEVVRILKSDSGQLIGFVPFLMWYHPDHHDYFRYTNEALERIFTDAGAKAVHVTPVSRGPMAVVAHMTLLMVPRIIRPILYVPMYCIDALYMRVRNDPHSKFALGYLFEVSK